MAIEDLKDLPPDERIAKLKKLEEEKKREIEEAEALIKDSMKELDSDDEKAPKSVQKATDITQLVSAEEKQIFRTVTGQSEAQQQQDRPAPQPQSLDDVADVEVSEEKKEEAQGGPVYGTDNNPSGATYKANTGVTGNEGPEGLYKQDTPDLYREGGAEERAGYAAKKAQEEQSESYHKGDDWTP